MHTHTHTLEREGKTRTVTHFWKYKDFVAGYTQPTSKALHSLSKKERQTDKAVDTYASQPDKKLSILKTHTY